MCVCSASCVHPPENEFLRSLFTLLLHKHGNGENGRARDCVKHAVAGEHVGVSEFRIKRSRIVSGFEVDCVGAEQFVVYSRVLIFYVIECGVV